MMYLRKVHFLIWALWNSRLAQPILRWMHRERHINPLDAIIKICEPKSGGPLDRVLCEYESEARAEWHDSPRSVLEEFSNRVEELKSGEFTKLNLKYLAKILLDKSLSREILQELADYDDTEIARELAKFSVDRLLDFNNLEKSKIMHYPVTVANALRTSYPQIPKDTSVCEFKITKKTLTAINKSLKAFDFEKKPVWAVAVSLQSLHNSFMYNFRFNKSSRAKAKPQRTTVSRSGWTSRWAPLN